MLISASHIEPVTKATFHWSISPNLVFCTGRYEMTYIEDVWGAGALIDVQ